MNTNVIQKQTPVNINRLKVAHNALNHAVSKPKYFIESVYFRGDVITVVYIDEAVLNSGLFNESDWKEKSLYFGHLKDFVITNDLNTYEHNSLDNDGCHVQTSGAIPVDHYLNENLNEAIKAYLERNTNHA